MDSPYLFTGPAIPLGQFPAVYTDNLNAAPATLKLAYSFTALDTNIDYFWISVGTVYGTDANRKVTFTLQSDSGGVPSGTDLVTPYEQVGGFATNTSKQITPAWSGVSLTVGTRYWVVVSNTATSPATDYIQIVRMIPTPLHLSLTTYNTTGAPYTRRSFNGTNWTTTVATDHTTLTIRYTSGKTQGLRATRANTYDSEWLVNGTRRVGFEFSCPPYAGLNIVGVSVGIMACASALAMNIFINRALVASSPSVAGTVSTANGVVMFPVKVSVMPGDTVGVMSDALPSSSLQIGGELLTNHADFISRRPMDAKIVKLDNETTWTTSNLVIPFAQIYLDAGQPFAPLPLNRRQFNAMR